MLFTYCQCAGGAGGGGACLGGAQGRAWQPAAGQPGGTSHDHGALPWGRLGWGLGWWMSLAQEGPWPDRTGLWAAGEQPCCGIAETQGCQQPQGADTGSWVGQGGLGRDSQGSECPQSHGKCGKRV